MFLGVHIINQVYVITMSVVMHDTHDIQHVVRVSVLKLKKSLLFTPAFLFELSAACFYKPCTTTFRLLFHLTTLGGLHGVHI